MAHGRIYVAGTCDTKGDELRYVKGLIEAAGVPAVLVDLGTKGEGGPADVAATEVAAHHPEGPGAVFSGDRGRAVSAMAVAFERFIRSRDDVAGLIGLGGSGGTALVTAGMRALPVGTPKLMVSTVASANVAPYVGPSDIAMMYSVTDIAGLNRISRTILANAAHAIAGMARPRAAGGRRHQARHRPHHVRRHHTLRDPRLRASGPGLRLPRLPRHRHRRPVDGEAGRIRAS